VDAGGLDRAVASLCLDRLERHAGLSQPGEAGMAQLMAGQVLDASAGAGAGHDLIESGR